MADHRRKPVLDEITIYPDQCVIVTMPPVDDSAIYSIANELADYGMSVKNEQVGEELEAALATIKNAGLEIK